MDTFKRAYRQSVWRIWRQDIERAEAMIAAGNACPEEEYQIVLDPEDFLDLCAGKWHTDDSITDRPA